MSRSIGETVKQRRQKLQMSPSQLAAIAGINHATLSRIESEEIKEPGPEILKKLATALQVTVDYLVGRTDSLTANEFVSSAPEAQELIKLYDEMKPFEREQLLTYARFLKGKKRSRGEGIIRGPGPRYRYRS